MRNIAIIGAGSSGLFIARQLAEQPQIKVYVFERAKNVGSKLRASGGGKANLFNYNILPEHYNQNKFIDNLLHHFTPEMLQKEFERFGLQIIADNEGRAYPCTEFSLTVVDTLRNNTASNIHWQTDYEVKRLFQAERKWHINDFPVAFDVVIIATGSPANLIAQNRMHYNSFLDPLHLKMQPLMPSLVGFKIAEYPKQLAGCRVKVRATLWQDQNAIYSERGEVTFKEDGLSGIVVMNLSAHYNRLTTKQNCWLSLDLMPQQPDYDTHSHWEKFHSVQGILHPKLATLYEKKSFDIHNLKLSISDTYDITSAQVCHGGIDLSEVNPDFSLKRFPELYATGEVLDVDGVCGGYNLFFAFASGWMVAREILVAR